MNRSPRSDPDLDPFRITGTIVDGRYLVERPVGAGGFAIVYRARHLRFDSPVALKVLHRSRGQGRARQREFAEHLLAEGKFLFDLAPLHESFVRVFETGSLKAADGTVAPYLALEWLVGATLRTQLQRWREQGLRLELVQVLSLFDGVARGLSIAHERRIAHRDIKPANIFLATRDGTVMPRILDFGLAKAMSESELGTDAFRDSTFAETPFTPAYGAPEQWQRRLGATGTWTDVHALALLCVELLSGQTPLAGEDSPSLMAACLDASCRPTPRTLGVAVPDAVEAVFVRALSVDPRRRQRDAREFWQALREAAGIVGDEPLPRFEFPLVEDVAPPADALDAPTASQSAAPVNERSASKSARGTTGPFEILRDVSRLRQGKLLPKVLVAAAIVAGLWSLKNSDRAPSAPTSTLEPSSHGDVAKPIHPTSVEAGAPILATTSLPATSLVPERSRVATTPRAVSQNAGHPPSRVASVASAAVEKSSPPSAATAESTAEFMPEPKSKAAPAARVEGLLDEDGFTRRK